MPEFLKTTEGRWLAIAAGAALLLYIVTRRGVAGSLASGVAETVVGTVRDVAAGTVVGIGKGLGIPETNADQCTLDLAAGRYVDASFSCPAPRYLSHVVMGQEDFAVRQQKFINANS